MGRQKVCKEGRYEKKKKIEGKHTKLHPYSCHVSAIQRYFGHMTTVEVRCISARACYATYTYPNPEPTGRYCSVAMP